VVARWGDLGRSSEEDGEGRRLRGDGKRRKGRGGRGGSGCRCGRCSAIRGRGICGGRGLERGGRFCFEDASLALGLGLGLGLGLAGRGWWRWRSRCWLGCGEMEMATATAVRSSVQVFAALVSAAVSVPQTSDPAQ